MLALSLPTFSGCSTAPKIVSRTEMVVAEPPAQLLLPCPKPYRPVTTTGGLVDQLTATRGALATCAAQVDGIRQWRDEGRAAAQADRKG